MRRMIRWLIGILVVAAVVGLVYLMFNQGLLGLIIDYWWFSSLDYAGYFWLRLIYRYLVFIVITGGFFLIFFLNFWVGSRYLGLSKASAEKRRSAERARYKTLLKMFKTGSLKVYTPLSLILAIPIGLPLYRQWEQTLLYLFGPAAGQVDPAFGLDISFYLFSYPVYTLIQRNLLIIFALLFLAMAVLYWAESRMLSKADQRLPRGARIHLTVLVLFVIAIQGWGYILEQFGLLYQNNPETVFYGPGFVKFWFDLPTIWLKVLMFTGGAVALIRCIHTQKGAKLVAAFAILFLMVIGLRSTDFIPDLIEAYVVAPNEMTRQRPYIENNITATLNAFDLNDVETRQYEVRPIMTLIAEDADLQKNLANIPVWDRDLLSEVYEQRQGIRPYYSFPGVDVDRYTVNGLYQQVFLAAREISTRKLPETAKSWINSRLQYTHGYGVVMTPAIQRGDEDIEWFMRDIPLRSELDYDLGQPGLYYGLEEYGYAIAPNDQGEVDHPKRDENILVNYDGTGGAPLSNLFRKLMFALHFRDKNIFFTTDTNNKSRILYRRNITEAIGILTPYLLLDEDPYVVVTPKRLYWIQDAYTISNQYPYVPSYDQQHYPGHRFNYIRNSVKIIVDAYNGDITFYRFDTEDPIVGAYDRMYPGLFKSMDEMPKGLKRHLRYPKSLFEIQMGVYTKYHQRDPELFYRQEDHWEFASAETVLQRAYYMTLNLINREQHEFMLLSPMSPINRDNLRALPLVGCDGDNYGRIVVYSFPKGEQVYGPAQVSALIDNDTRIAQELTLWDQAGSKINRGRMIIFPVSNTILYIQPVYLISTARAKIPELIRIIISQGSLVEMDVSIETGFRKLAARVHGKEDETVIQETGFDLPADPRSPRLEAEPDQSAPPDEASSEPADATEERAE